MDDARLEEERKVNEIISRLESERFARELTQEK